MSCPAGVFPGSAPLHWIAPGPQKQAFQVTQSAHALHIFHLPCSFMDLQSMWTISVGCCVRLGIFHSDSVINICVHSLIVQLKKIFFACPIKWLLCFTEWSHAPFPGAELGVPLGDV